jgi:hypothetical protein
MIHGFLLFRYCPQYSGRFDDSDHEGVVMRLPFEEGAGIENVSAMPARAGAPTTSAVAVLPLVLLDIRFDPARSESSRKAYAQKDVAVRT